MATVATGVLWYAEVAARGQHPRVVPTADQPVVETFADKVMQAIKKLVFLDGCADGAIA